ncbi:hypothetical protein VP01_2333g2 [Puccinia sorghi]|uniref:Uncharacterized protein n=1 Tax=Puccinia sorghi TaxID=27349 RepID=A0A0L6V7E7_9BASI|nr:hypothetical protein VP01_2333g2 [Puccinia sorghi]
MFIKFENTSWKRFMKTGGAFNLFHGSKPHCLAQKAVSKKAAMLGVLSLWHAPSEEEKADHKVQESTNTFPNNEEIELAGDFPAQNDSGEDGFQIKGDFLDNWFSQVSMVSSTAVHYLCCHYFQNFDDWHCFWYHCFRELNLGAAYLLEVPKRLQILVQTSALPKKETAQLPEVDTQKLPGSFFCYSNLSPRMKARLEHAACQLQAVEKLFFAVLDSYFPGWWVFIQHQSFFVELQRFNSLFLSREILSLIPEVSLAFEDYHIAEAEDTRLMLLLFINRGYLSPFVFRDLGLHLGSIVFGKIKKLGLQQEVILEYWKACVPSELPEQSARGASFKFLRFFFNCSWYDESDNELMVPAPVALTMGAPCPWVALYCLQSTRLTTFRVIRGLVSPWVTLNFFQHTRCGTTPQGDRAWKVNRQLQLMKL